MRVSMSWLARLVNVFRAGKVSDDIDRELEFHLAERADELTAAGASPEAARLRGAAAPRQLQHPARERPRARSARLARIIRRRRALRPARARSSSRSSRITTILTLAIGIGANTTVFTLLHGLLLRSLPVTAPQELVRIDLTLDTRQDHRVGVDYGMLKRIDELDRTFAGISALEKPIRSPSKSADGTLRFTDVAFVTGNAFDLLGLRPRLGRLLTPRGRCGGRSAGSVAGRAQRCATGANDSIGDRIGARQDDPDLRPTRHRDWRHARFVPRRLGRRRTGDVPAAPLHERHLEEGHHQSAGFEGGSVRHWPAEAWSLGVGRTRRADGPRTTPDRRVRERRLSRVPAPAPAWSWSPRRPGCRRCSGMNMRGRCI